MEQVIDVNKQFKKASVLLLVLSLTGIIVISMINNFSLSKFFKEIILVFVVNLILICYLGIFKERILLLNHTWWMIGVAYIISIACMFTRFGGNDIPYWMIGGVLVAGTIDLNFGLVISYSLTILSATIYGVNSQQLVLHLILCAYICILAGFLKRVSNMFYVLIVAVSMNITLLLVFRGFKMNKVFSADGIATICYCVFILLLVHFLEYLAKKWFWMGEDDFIAQIEFASASDMFREKSDNILEELLEDKNQKLSMEAISPPDLNIHQSTQGINVNWEDKLSDVKTVDKIITNAEDKEIASQITIDMEDEVGQQINISTEGANTFIDALNNNFIDIEQLDFDLEWMKNEFERTKYLERIANLKIRLEEIVHSEFELIVRMKEEFPKLYQHAKITAEIARDAAKHIHADERIAYAGGWYHEVGKLCSRDNFIYDGIKLANEYKLPDCIIDIIRQHNHKIENPTSVESAIILLIDTIKSSLVALKRTSTQPINIEKTINKIFSIFLDKGILLNANMSLNAYQNLKLFFIQYFLKNTE